MENYLLDESPDCITDISVLSNPAAPQKNFCLRLRGI